MNIFQHIFQILKRRFYQAFGMGSLLLERPEMPKQKPMPRHEGRTDRKHQRAVWDFAKWKWHGEHNHPPMLRGARLARTQDACSPKHLTVLCAGARATWGQQ